MWCYQKSQLPQEIFWTDSAAVLGYIRNQSRKFNMFVANRVEIIWENSCDSQWFHVKTKANPADYCSREINKTYTKATEIWLNGPPFSDFLTHGSIQQMPTWLPMWRAKSLYHISTSLQTWFFLPLQKFKTIKIKLEKNTYTQANMCLLHISRNFKDIFKYICFTLYL